MLLNKKLNSTETSDVQKTMIWDSYKQKLIVNSKSTLYVIGIQKSLIEFYYYDIDQIVQIQLITNANILQISSYQSCTFIDYDYLISDNKETFPNQIHPRYFKVNDNSFLHLNDVNSQANLFVNNKIKASWIRNNLFSGYIRIVENDLDKYLLYAIYDQEIAILDVSNGDLTQIDQYFLTQNIINILHEDSKYIFLLSQSSQILILSKKQKTIQINESIILTQGIVGYIFSNNSMQLFYTDQSTNLKINIITFNLVQGSLKGQYTTSIIKDNRIVHFKFLTDTLLVVLLENYLITYDTVKMQKIKEIPLPTQHLISNIKVDKVNNRVFIQNRNTGSLIFDYNLISSPLVKINTFSNDLSFDDHFIYSITSHSANIYFRKDLKMLINFRHFDNSLTLKKITYLGEGYIFMVEFLTKLSIYEFSPFISEPIQKNFVVINQYNVIKYSLQNSNINSKSNIYELNIIGITQEGMFSYIFKFDIFNQEVTKSCSLSFALSDQPYQEAYVINQITQQLTDQKTTLEKLYFSILSGQLLHFPKIPSQIISSNFGFTLQGQNGGEQVFISDTQNSQSTITSLQLEAMELKIQSRAYTTFLQFNIQPPAFEIDLIKFPKLKQFSLEDITLNEVQLLIKDINQVLIKSLIIKNSNKYQQEYLNSLTRLKISNAKTILITSLKIDQCYFKTQNPLVEISDVEKVTIGMIQIQNAEFKDINKIISFARINQIEIQQIQFIDNKYTNSSILSFLEVISLKINILVIKDIEFIFKSKNKLRQLQNNEQLTLTMIDMKELQTIQIDQIDINNIQSDADAYFQIFSIKHIKSQLIINLSQFKNIQVEEGQQGVILSLKGIYNVLFKNMNIEFIQQIQFLILDSYQISEVYSFTSYSIDIQKLNVYTYQISESNIINISSQIIKFSEANFNNIEMEKKSDQVIHVIQIKVIINLSIINSNFQYINQNNGSIIQIQDSSNILIEKSQFSIINSYNSGSTISIQSTKVVKLQGNTFKLNNSQQQSGVLIFKSSSKIDIQNNKFILNKSQQGLGGCIYSIESKFDNISSNDFNSNLVEEGSGGAISCFQGSIQNMDSNSFIQNKALNGSGGAIYLNDCDILKFNKNILSSNQAFIGGAIRYQVRKPYFLIQSDLSNVKKNNQFKRNNCISYGKDFASYPIVLDVKNSFNDDDMNQKAIVEDVQSGYKADNPIYLRLIDEEMKEINFVDLSQYPKVMNEIKEEFFLYILQIESTEIGLLGDLKQSYTKEQFAFIFDVSYSYKPDSQSYIKIKSSSSLPYFPPNQQTMQLQIFEISVQIKFRKCQVGEVIQNSGEYILCYTCEKGFYSIANPYSNEDKNCIRCPIGSTECYGSTILLEDGYWRLNEESDKIVYCSNNPESCMSQSSESKQGCIKGFVGPLCEECDVKGIVWGDLYAKTSEFKCMNCSQFNTYYNILIFIVIFTIIIAQIFFKAYKQQLATKQYILAVYLCRLGFVSPSIQKSQTTSSSLMKILLSYFQFMMIVNSLNMYIPVYFTAFSVSGGDTSQHTINRIDCLIFQFSKDLPIYIFRIIWVNLQPLLLFIFLEILSQINFQKKQIDSQRQSLYTNLIIVFSFFQPSVTKVLSQSISCRQIGDQLYILSDLNEKCLTEEHYYHFYSIILPLGIFWIVFSPLFLFFRMKHYKNQMGKIKIIYRYGYLYQEYQHEHYYWDIIRTFIRSFAIITINVFNFRVLFKGLVIIGLIQLYKALLNRKKPYLLSKLNTLDKESCNLVINTLYLLYVGYLSENDMMNFIMGILVGLINGKFVLKMISLLFIKPISPIQKQRNVFQVFLYNLKQKYPQLFTWVQISNTNRTPTFMHWKKLQRRYKELKLFQFDDNKSSLRRSMLRRSRYVKDYYNTQSISNI